MFYLPQEVAMCMLRWTKQHSAVAEAIERGDIDTVKRTMVRWEWLRHVSPESGLTLMHVAVREGNLECIEFFLQCTYALHVGDNEARFPLYLAIENQNEILIRMMLKHDAKISRLCFRSRPQISDGDSLLWSTIKCFSSWTGIIVPFVQIVTPQEWEYARTITDFHVAAAAGYDLGVRLLCQQFPQSVDITLISVGWTPLHIAAFKGHTSIIQILMSFGASTEATTHSGLKPIHLARIGNHHTAIAALSE